MMGLQHASIVVEHSERVARVAEEGGRGAGVVDVVRRRRDERSGRLDGLQESLQAVLLEEVCYCLRFSK